MTIPQYINKAFYDKDSVCILAVSNSGEYQLLLDVRGWGNICNLFPDGDKAIEFQDNLGQYIADAINEKLNRKQDEP